MGVLLSICVLTVCLTAEEGRAPQSEEAGGNAKCYVCHSGLKTEDITTAHLDMGITCDCCHGQSTEHMHDEMLMTEPDLLFGRAEVQKMCSNPSCHKPGEGRMVYGRQDHADMDKVEAFFDKWQGRVRPNGRVVSADSVCTDCHGTHNLNKAVSESAEQPWLPLFNGKDLTGWKKPEGGSWKVESGRLLAKLDSKGRGGSIFTAREYGDYQAAVTFRAKWPVRAGIWVRYNKARPGARIEILEDKSSGALTGSLRWSGKGLVLVNLQEDLVDKGGWNTISIKAEGRRVSVWLNGEAIGSARVGGPVKGRVGFYIGVSEENPELSIREIMIQELKEDA